jgi:nuclear pore complex protein Nup93
MWQMIINDYRRFVRQRSDPYMHACYTLFGRCEVGVGLHSQILTSAQDFLWFKLALVRETNETLPHLFLRHDYRLQQLQELVLDHGPAHFSADGTQPLLYFQVLLATQQFEEAIRYLLSSSQHQVDAVHFGVALYYYGLLSLPPSDSAPRDLLFGQGSGSAEDHDAAARPWINVERLLRQYVRLFAATDPLDAMQYLNLLQDQSQKAVAMRDLVLQTREFEVLLGAVRGDGTRQAGCIDRFLPPHEVRHIMELAAHAALERGLHQDAVQLYFKAANYDRVVAILNQQMSRMLTGQPGADRNSVAESGASDVAGAMPQHSDSERGRLFTLANVLYSRHGSLLSSVRHRDLLRTFHLLRRLGKLFDHYHRRQFAEALQTATSIGLVPVSTAEMAEKVDAFRALDPTILRNFAEILIAHMTVLHSLYSMITPASPAVTPRRGVMTTSRLGSEQEVYLWWW